MFEFSTGLRYRIRCSSFRPAFTLFLYDLQAALGSYREFAFAADVLCIEQGIIPMGIGEDEEAIAQALKRPGALSREEMLRDLPILRLRDAQCEVAQLASAILAGFRAVCEEEVGLSPEQLIGSAAPLGLEALAFAKSIHDLDPKPKEVKACLERYRMVWKEAEAVRKKKRSATSH